MFGDNSHPRHRRQRPSLPVRFWWRCWWFVRIHGVITPLLANNLSTAQRPSRPLPDFCTGSPNAGQSVSQCLSVNPPDRDVWATRLTSIGNVCIFITFTR